MTLSRRTIPSSSTPSRLLARGKCKPLRTRSLLPRFQTLPVRDNYETVLAGAGASRPVRDAADARIVDEVRHRGGAIIDSQVQVGAWPELKSTTPPVDSDHDGVPDDWETRHELRTLRDPSDGPRPAVNGGGYTNLEMYLNALAGGDLPVR